LIKILKSFLKIKKESLVQKDHVRTVWQKEWLIIMFLTKKTWSIKVIAAVLVAITFGLASDAQNEKLIASYNADPTKVLNEAKQALEQKDFVIAKNRIEKYL
jgi:hypothetical protein